MIELQTPLAASPDAPRVRPELDGHAVRALPQGPHGAGFVAPTLRFRSARAEDGPDVAKLVRACPGLDANSEYAYVLVCDAFGDSCVLVRDDAGELVGFVTGFTRPKDPSRLFLWQIGVRASHRGRGLGSAMLSAFVARGSSRGTRYLETTVAAGNDASLSMFRAYARSLGTTLVPDGIIPRAWLGGAHADEVRYLIELPGPVR